MIDSQEIGWCVWFLERSSSNENNERNEKHMFIKKRILLSSLLAISSVGVGQATLIIVADHVGNVGLWNTDTNSGIAVTSVAGVAQVIGAAYDPTSGDALIFDRSNSNVITVDLGTGASSTLFNAGFSFQGGAVSGGLIYGINESSQTIEAFDFGGVNQGLTAPSFGGHSHGLGVDAGTGTMYHRSSVSNQIQVINADGTTGALSTSYANNIEDLEYFGGDFLVASFSEEVLLVDGVTGAESLFLTAAQVDGMGVTGSVSGIAVVAGGGVIPEPSRALLLTAGLGLFFGRRKRS